MAQSLEEQVNVIERALGERMIMHALAIFRVWLNELGEENTYEEAYNDLLTRYMSFFSSYLTADDSPEREQQLTDMTSEAYRMMDSAYVALRLKRGLSPEMHGFNQENPQSVMRYFSSCIRFRDEDLGWLNRVFSDASYASIGLVAVAALSKNLRECFNEGAFMALINGISSESPVVAEQCLANSLLLLIHYDVRIDFFPSIQEAFMEAIDDGSVAFDTICAMIRSTNVSLRDMLAKQEINFEDLPQELQDLLSMTGSDISGVAAWMPSSEREYMSGLMQILPDTWLYSVLVEDNEERERIIKFMFLSIGKMDLLWDDTEAAERWLVGKMRSNEATTMDYINYGHCLLLRGDRMMAYENYRQARSMCKNSKEFYALFRPDRRQLVDHGVPMEQVYLLEDQLLAVNN